MIISQIDLIHAITRHLERRYKIKDVNARQFNAVIAASSLVVEAFGEPHRPATPGMGLEAWYRCDETGRSSLVMARTLAPRVGRKLPWGIGPRPNEVDHPLDPSDFGRCIGLLIAEPALRAELPALAGLSPPWAALVAHWDELEALYREELPSGQAPKLYGRMKGLFDQLKATANSTPTPEETDPCSP